MIADEAARLRLLVVDEDTGRLVHRATTAYRPTPEQIALIRAQYVFSVEPGSHVLAGRTDTDHAVPHPEGPTPSRLSVTVDDTGAVKWTSVLGQSRTVTPYDYGTHLPDENEPDDGPTEAPKAEPPPF